MELGTCQVHSSYAAFTAVEFGLFIVSVPIPFVLNSFWFYLLFVGLCKFIAKKDKLKSDKQKAEAAAKAKAA